MWVLVAFGGVLGTLARYSVQLLIPTRAPADFPTATLLVNLLGSLVLGCVVGYAAAGGGLSPRTQAALATGFCGAFTTMSTFGLETVNLVSTGHLSRAVVYLGVTVFGSIAAAAAGLYAMQRLT